MKITFKNVGQGDSIILEWDGGLHGEIGIIDCKKTPTGNPIIEHLERIKPERIAFVLLSHPHFDHFSGMADLLTYCNTEGIKIQHFMHTMNLDPRYLHWAILEEEGKQALRLLIDLINTYSDPELLDRTIIQEIWVGLKSTLVLNDHWKIARISPSAADLKLYQRIVERNAKDFLKCSRSANLLSSILVLSGSKDSNILLTSDAMPESFERIISLDSLASETRLTLVQIPHHGSIENHCAAFWKSFRRKQSNCPAVVSAGEHRSYFHPHEEVVSAFEEWGFMVHATNHVNGMFTFLKSDKGRRIHNMLDDISIVVDDSISEGDQIFVFEEGKSRRVPEHLTP